MCLHTYISWLLYLPGPTEVLIARALGNREVPTPNGCDGFIDPFPTKLLLFKLYCPGPGVIS